MWLLFLLLGQAPTPDPYLLLKGDTLPPGPLAINAVAPVFPDELLASSKPLTVLVDVEVAGGLVRRAGVVEGENPKAREAALHVLPMWRFASPEGGSRAREVRLVFVFRPMPEGTPPEELTTVFRNKYEIEVRRSGAPSHAAR